MRILLAGAAGFVGTELSRYFTQNGDEVVSLVRDFSQIDSHHFYWDPARSKIDPKAFDGVDVVINLAGENIAKRWTKEAKKKILDSRIETTRTLALGLLLAKKPPQLYIQASAFGYYGDRKDQLCQETAPPGKGFLADVCVQWEKAAKPIIANKIRTVIFRFGIILSPRGGFLAKMLPLFRFFLGAQLGRGSQYISWIALDDLLSAMQFAITNPAIKGTINLVSPNPVTNAAFTRTLNHALYRSTLFSIPAPILHLFFGRERADELFLSSTRADSSLLQSFGYKFLYPELDNALHHLLSKK